MKLIKFIPVVLTIAMAQSMSSCLKENSDSYKVNEAYPNLFNAVVELSTGDITLYPEQSYKIEWDLVNQTATVQVNGLKIPNGGSYPTLYLNDVPWKYNSKGWYDITLSDYVPFTSAGTANGLVLNRFNFQTIIRTINNITFPPCLDISYTVNNEYKIFTMPMEIIDAGVTTITASDGTKFEQSGNIIPIYYLELDPTTKKAFIVIQNAQFYKDMEMTLVKLTPLDMQVNQAGHITCTGTDLVPGKLNEKDGINGKTTPMDDYLITDFNATYMSDYGFTVTYKCTYKGEVYSAKFVSEIPKVSPTAKPSISN